MTALLEAEVDGDKLTEMDFNLFFLLLAVAGNETTRNSISHGINAFCEFPEQYQLLVDDPGLASSATEEIVRWASPVMYFRRNVMRDTEIRGNEIKAGDKISMWYISGNRDEEVFDDPFTFDIRRDPNEHVGFGGGGPHHCLGANLARMEIRVLLEEMARRIPTLERVDDADPLRSNFIAGIKHMDVKFPAGARS
jgi:cholest-4-en-3-one 26-monooxygenase